MIGLVVILLAVTVLSPIPFASIIPNLAIMLLALGLLEKDGVFLAAALFVAAASLAITVGSVWVTIVVPRYL